MGASVEFQKSFKGNRIMSNKTPKRSFTRKRLGGLPFSSKHDERLRALKTFEPIIFQQSDQKKICQTYLNQL